MAAMKAAQIREYGGKSVVSIDLNAAEPKLLNGSLLVAVRAASVNPFDWKVREGLVSTVMPLQLPATLGGDFSGVVIDVGEGVSSFKKGDSVYGQASVFGGNSGAFAERLVVKAGNVGHKPEAASYNEAAALVLTGVSALQALTEHLTLSKGQRILIHGGAGGIGTHAIPLAKYLGAFVATTASAGDLDYVQKLGADQVIDYTKERFADVLHDYDAVYDTVGGETYRESFTVLKPGGILVSMVEKPDQGLMERYHVKAIGQATFVNTERLRKLASLFDQRVLQTHIDSVFPIEAAAEAIEYVKTGHPRGKVVIAVS